MKNLMSIALATLAVLPLGPIQAQSLLGSRASMERQHQEAVSYGYTFLGTPQAVSTFVSEGHLVKVSDNQYIELHDVSYPYSRPEVKMFIERLSNQYYATCGEKLVVTSLTRPIDEQPENAASDSVHPTGMAVDMHVPSTARCRSWLERTLLSMESSGLLDVTRERHPAHYHVAVFTRSYENYVAVRPAAETPVATPATSTTVAASNSVISSDEALSPIATVYTVRKGDSLATIADSAGITTAALKSLNKLRGSKLKPGQRLQVPASTATPDAPVADRATSITASAKHSQGMITIAQARVKENTSFSELTHRVKRGDTLWRIANRYGITAEQIKRENGLKDDVVNVGQKLRIRSTTSRNSLASNNS